MRFLVTTLLFYFFIDFGICLWTKGIVHYAINKKDYDPHSQDIIMSAMAKLENEICVKFFVTPLNYTTTEETQILYINNADKRKTCPPQRYEFGKSVVNMAIGYKCLNERDITRLIVEMLRASINPGDPMAKFDMIRKLNEQDHHRNQTRSTSLISTSDRNFINTHYKDECNELLQKPATNTRRFVSGNIEISVDNEKFYKNKLWPLGIVMFGVEKGLHNTQNFLSLRFAMLAVELVTCIVFQYIEDDDVLVPRNFVWFSLLEGDEMPRLGFTEGNQTLLLNSMVLGAPNHSAHTLNMLLRILGIPMMSNRFDRDNYVTINWKNVDKRMAHYLERAPIEAMLKNSDGDTIPYDFTSVTHAPANYLCADCSLGQQTVAPIQDQLWQRTLQMGHRNDLNPTDIETLNLLYSKQCQSRFGGL